MSTGLAQNVGPDGPRATVTNQQQGPKTTQTVQSFSIISAVSTYETHLTAQPAYKSVSSVLATADIPPSIVSQLQTGAAPIGTSAVQTMSWFTALPTDVQSYFKSVWSEEVKLATQTANSGERVRGAATGAIFAVAGFAAGAAMMLG